MSISPQPKSNEASRPASPAADALEVLSLDDEAISPGEDAIRMKSNLNRKTSSWKGFKSQFTKAEAKIKSTLSKDRKAIDGTIISPTELSPESVESGESTSDDEKTEKIADLIKNIEELGAECDKEIFAPSKTSTTTTAPNSCSVSGSSNSNDKKKVDFAEEPCRKISMPVNEGAGISRPTELSFNSNRNEGLPIAPPRMKKEKRLERLLSVPNIKLNKQEQNRLLNLRKISNVVGESSKSPSSSSASNTAMGAPSSSSKNLKGNFMRRFSKYQFHSNNQSIKKQITKQKIPNTQIIKSVYAFHCRFRHNNNIRMQRIIFQLH
jgi:hypothetical protein